MVSSNIVTNPHPLVLIHGVESKCNLSNITKTVLVDISTKPRIVENIYMGKICFSSELRSYMALFNEFRDICACTYEENLGIDPSIMAHEIRTYPDAKSVR